MPTPDSDTFKQSLILHGALALAGRSSASSIPTLWWPVMHWYTLAGAGVVHLLLNVGSVLDVLMEAADMAAHIVIWLHAERDDGDKTECEPLPVVLVSSSSLRIATLRRAGM